MGEEEGFALKHEEALRLATDLVDLLSPGCLRIEVAGSVRRGKPECKDLEIVAIPEILDLTPEINLFGEAIAHAEVNTLEAVLGDLYSDGVWVLDQELRRNGPRYKRLRHNGSGMCCDLFIVTPAGWGGAMVIRTGPAAFSQAIVTLALRQGKHVADGYLLHGHSKPKGGCPKGADCPLIVPTPEERDFLGALNLPWIEPDKRIYAVVELFDMAGF